MSGRGPVVRRARLAGHPKWSRAVRFIEIEIGPLGKTGPIAIVGPGRFATSASDYRVMAGPSIDSFAPAFGAPGTRVVLRGRGFQPGDQVLLGEKVLDVAASSAEALTVVIPDDADAGSLSVRRGAARSSSAKAFEVVLPPIVAGFEPTGGPAETRVVLRGRHLAADARVLLGDRPAPILAREGAESAPAHATGCALTVAIPNGASSAPFTVITRAGQGISARAFSVLGTRKSSRRADVRPSGHRVTLSGSTSPRTACWWASARQSSPHRPPRSPSASRAPSAPIVVKRSPHRLSTDFPRHNKTAAAVARVPPPDPPVAKSSSRSGDRSVAKTTAARSRPLAVKILPAACRRPSARRRDGGTFELVRAGGKERVRADRSFDVTGR